ASEQLQANVSRILERMHAACDRAGRPHQDVQLIAVTKYATPDIVQALAASGTRHLGESRPQRLWELGESIQGSIEWHLIGHLQRNKVARTLPYVTLIHSVDSERLLREIDKVSAEQQRVAACLLEVNISGDDTKHGWRPDALPAAIEFAAQFEHVGIKGLMTMAARAGGSARAAEDFANMRELRDRLRPNCPPSISLDELSMGMSGDFEVAIEQGATLVRVGSALFEGL
ncbi:MAG: YggS family pyridoxal phosphate-dependent enzyme, partial [Planctomycetota bacterium]